MSQEKLSEPLDSKITEGKHHWFDCSMCGAPLAEVIVNRPNIDIKTIVYATCSCGDKSYKQEIVGGFVYGRREENTVQIIDTPCIYNEEGHLEVKIITKKR